MDLETFTAERSDRLDSLADLVRPAIVSDLDSDDPVEGLEDTLISAYSVAFEEQFGTAVPDAQVGSFMADMEPALARLNVAEPDDRQVQVDRLALWFSTAITGHLTASQGGAEKTWITMRDEDVRDVHSILHGSTVPMADTFTVGTSPPALMQYPGQPVGPPEAWINCRCVLAIDSPSLVAAALEPLVEQEIQADDDLSDIGEVPGVDEDQPVHGVLAPIGSESGDGRTFKSLSHRDLPLPLKWQRAGKPEHEGDVVVGRIDQIVEDGNLQKWAGFLLEDVTETEEVIMLIANQALRGVSVEADQAKAELSEDGEHVSFDARATGATIVATPAFPEAFIQLGEAPWLDEDATEVAPDDEDATEAPETSMSAEPCCAECGDHGERCDDKVAASVEMFKRGSGWTTHPEETNRLHSYWTTGPGAAKIRWGTGGDFTRCTRQLRKYISPAFLNRTCAEWHHDALGYWPGELGKPGNPPATKENRRRAARHASLENDMEPAEMFTLTAAAPPTHMRREWFENPQLTEPTPAVWGPDGRCFGHLATFGECHIGISDECVMAPKSRTDYAYFHTGTVDLIDGSQINAGRITFNTGHADAYANFAATVAHYDDTGTLAAQIRVGEDAHGIWFAGGLCLLPEADLRTLKASAGLSGDWRLIGGNLELVAALAVNVPGFPIPKTSLAASGAKVTSLVAANTLKPRAGELSIDGIAEAVAAAIETRAENKARRTKVLSAAAALKDERRAKVLASID